jgi:DNA-directed RNA polymerase, mitochondrial
MQATALVSFAQDDTDTLLDAQKLIETRSTKDGYDRYIKAQDSAVSNLGGHAAAEAVKLIRGSIPVVSKKISDWVAENDHGGRGRRHVALATIKRFDPDLLAFLTLNCIFAGITQEQQLVTIQSSIGGQVEAEVMGLDIEEAQGRKVANRVKAKVSQNGSYHQRKRVFNKLAKEHIPQHQSWTQEQKVRIAEPLLNAALLSLPDLFELTTLPVGVNRRQTVIRLTDDGVQTMAQLRESMAWMAPIHRPMVVPPRPWTGMDTGCYYEPRASRTVKLVRTYNKDHKVLIRKAIEEGTMDHVIDAVNAIQSTAWAINKDIFDLVSWAFNTGQEIDGIPANELLAIPAKLEADVWEAMSKTERKRHRIALAGIHERNRGIVSDQAVLLRDLETAKELVDYASFWLPHNLDFRGRVYPVPHFNHQRADAIKAMFQFAEGKPLGEYGAGWLSIHLANCGDFEKVSKKPFDARLDWVEDNELMILQIGKDPKGTLKLWKDADSPFMFVAACIDYTRWVQSGRSNDYVSRLAIALDGSNSGLQHYAAALRSKDEAALVSLVPCDKPADLYQTVADQVRVAVEAEAAEGSAIAQQVLDAGISRTLVKRNVMTFAYSSEQFGFRQQLMDDLMRPLNDQVFLGRIEANPYATYRKDKDGNVTEELDGGFAASGYLAAQVWKAVTATVTKATEGMDFFKRIAAVLAHEKLPLIWTTPLGLPVVHRYSIWETKRVSLNLYDRAMPVVDAGVDAKVTDDGQVLRRVLINMRTAPTDRIDKDKARSAVAPNVIHSMDGSHLMLTVLNAKAEGLQDFALIHDSFGTHAGSTARFFEIIRESFVEMYAAYCPFEEVLDYASEVLSDEGVEKLPVLPSKGDMELLDVLNAEYAFA